jgi:hypothetical protein
MKFKTWLSRHDACRKAREWVGDMSAPKAWAKCEQADWMIWLVIEATLLDDRSLRLFAADCAEHVLHFFEEKCPKDDRPRKAIQAARDFANGTIGAAARDAAGDAAWAAARAAAWDAAGAAARAAAWAAARAAAWGAAGDAAWAAAGDAAWAAAGAAAWAAELKWQADKIRECLPTIPELGVIAPAKGGK